MMMRNYHLKPEEVDRLSATLLDVIKIVEEERAKGMENATSGR